MWPTLVLVYRLVLTGWGLSVVCKWCTFCGSSDAQDKHVFGRTPAEWGEKVCNQVEVINTNVTDHSGLHKAISRLLSVTLNSILGQKLQTFRAYQQLYWGTRQRETPQLAHNPFLQLWSLEWSIVFWFLICSFIDYPSVTYPCACLHFCSDWLGGKWCV